MRSHCSHHAASWGCISQPYSSLELDLWKDFISNPVKADVAELCGEEQSHRDNKRPKWQLATTLLEKEPRFWFSVGSILNLLGLFNQTKYFFLVRQIKVKYFLWQNYFWGTFLFLRFFCCCCCILVFFSPSCPMEDFSSVKRNSQYTACVSWVSHLRIYHWLCL